MSIQCEHCGGTLQVRGYEQDFGNPKSRRWQLTCRVCGLLHEYDSVWIRIPSDAPAAPAPAPIRAAQLPVPAMA